MSLWVCQKCTAAYAVGLLACPQCGSTDYLEDWQMGKISSTGLATHAPAPEVPEAEVPAEPEVTDAPAPVPVREQLAAGVPPEATVTIADQKAGVAEVPVLPAPAAEVTESAPAAAAAAAEKPATTPPVPAKPAESAAETG
jgi:hypothetical protein